MEAKYRSTTPLSNGDILFFFRKVDNEIIYVNTYRCLITIDMDFLFAFNESDKNYIDCTAEQFNAAFELVKEKINNVKLY